MLGIISRTSCCQRIIVQRIGSGSSSRHVNSITNSKGCYQSKTFSSSSSTTPTLLEGDIGNAGVKIHHTLQKLLAVMAPLYFLTPDKYTDGTISKTFGLALSTSISIHAWIGLNYVCRDYVPKISSKLLGPARIITFGFTSIMFLGMAKISMNSPGGLKGLLKGLWTAPKPVKVEKEF